MITLNLQSALAVIGIFLVILIYALSKWSSFRVGRNPENPAAENFSPKNPNFKLDKHLGQSNTPNLEPAAEPYGEKTDLHGDELHFDAADEPAFPKDKGDAQTQTEQPDHSQQALLFEVADGFERLSQIDYWVKITGTRDIGRETALAIYRDGSTDFSKHHSIYGLRLPENIWCNLENEHESSRFSDIVLTIQLADNSGSISESEMTQFSDLVLRLSEGTGRNFLFMTSIENAIAQGQAIANFISHFNSSVVLRVRHADGGTFSGTEINNFATHVGLESNKKNYYSRFRTASKNKSTLYSFANSSDSGEFDFDNMENFHTPELIFYTIPALNSSPGKVFNEMLGTAKLFATRVNGILDSVEHFDVSSQQLESMRTKIDHMATAMMRCGIPAGSPEAMRIF